MLEESVDLFTNLDFQLTTEPCGKASNSHYYTWSCICLFHSVEVSQKTIVKMTEHNQEFETWLSDRLGHFNADGDVFSTYIFGILDGDESTDEKQTNLCDLLEGLGLDDGSPDPCQRIEKEIWAKWNNLGENYELLFCPKRKEYILQLLRSNEIKG